MVVDRTPAALRRSDDMPKNNCI